LITVVFAERKVRDTEETREEEKHGRSFSALSAGAYHTTTWLLMVILSPPVAVFKQEF
jgi:hypothetical protein